MSEEPLLGHNGRVVEEHEALWTRVFADWLEEQTALALRELEEDGAAEEGDGLSARRAPGADRVSRAR